MLNKTEISDIRDISTGRNSMLRIGYEHLSDPLASLLGHRHTCNLTRIQIYLVRMTRAHRVLNSDCAQVKIC